MGIVSAPDLSKAITSALKGCVLHDLTNTEAAA